MGGRLDKWKTKEKGILFSNEMNVTTFSNYWHHNITLENLALQFHKVADPIDLKNQ